jgi:hypothetical protein
LFHEQPLVQIQLPYDFVTVEYVPFASQFSRICCLRSALTTSVLLRCPPIIAIIVGDFK